MCFVFYVLSYLNLKKIDDKYKEENVKVLSPYNRSINQRKERKNKGETPKETMKNSLRKKELGSSN